jgi:prolyl-tRNA editing enzyme YbaK/EbsC (Cys-tRNA(Pro) deacylase)
MSLESVRAFFAEKAPDISVIESGMSSATVALAAEAYGVEPARIAKTLSLRIGERVVLIVAAGTSRMDNKKVKALFGVKPKMLGLEEVAEITGHEVGGVCPFGLKTPLPIYCDVSLKAFDVVRTMTGGNFGTSVVANEFYSQSFRSDNQGLGAALAVLLFVLVIPIVVYNIRQLRASEAR